jgi:hypothetical protein
MFSRLILSVLLTVALIGAGAPLAFAADPDSDYDGLTDPVEVAYGTDPNDPDSDHDGLMDGIEVGLGTDPLSPDQHNGSTEWYKNDTDGVGALDKDEFRSGTDPLSRDTDRDGVDDAADHNPLRPDPLGTSTDWDGDGVSNDAEATFGLNPLNPDTKGDGRGDAVMIRDILDKLYGPDEIRNADLRALAGVAAIPSQQAAFDAAVKDALSSTNLLEIDRAFQAVQAVTGREPPASHKQAMDELVSNLKKALHQLDADALRDFFAALGRQISEEEAKSFLNDPAGMLSASRQAQMAGDSVDPNTPLGKAEQAIIDTYMGEPEGGSSDQPSGGSGSTGSDPTGSDPTGTHHTGSGSGSSGSGSGDGDVDLP